MTSSSTPGDINPSALIQIEEMISPLDELIGRDRIKPISGDGIASLMEVYRHVNGFGDLQFPRLGTPLICDALGVPRSVLASAHATLERDFAITVASPDRGTNITRSAPLRRALVWYDASDALYRLRLAQCIYGGFGRVERGVDGRSASAVLMLSESLDTTEWTDSNMRIRAAMHGYRADFLGTMTFADQRAWDLRRWAHYETTASAPSLTGTPYEYLDMKIIPQETERFFLRAFERSKNASAFPLDTTLFSRVAHWRMSDAYSEVGRLEAELASTKRELDATRRSLEAAHLQGQPQPQGTERQLPKEEREQRPVAPVHYHGIWVPSNGQGSVGDGFPITATFDPATMTVVMTIEYRYVEFMPTPTTFRDSSRSGAITLGPMAVVEGSFSGNYEVSRKFGVSVLMGRIESDGLSGGISWGDYEMVFDASGGFRLSAFR